jgi:hypothetical protein
MKALTIKRPWANLIASGHKTIELRTWAPSEVPCRIAIHVGKEYDSRAGELILFATDENTNRSKGQVLCTVEVYRARPATLADCNATCLSSTQMYKALIDAQAKRRTLLAWELRNVQPIAPTYHIGKLGLWQLP